MFRTHNQLQLLLSAVSSCRSLLNCQSIHAIVIKSHFINDGFIGDQLVSFYSKLGFNDYARKLFDEIPEKDLVSWNSFISGCSRSGVLGFCLDAYRRMRKVAGLRPNEVTLLSVISACTVVGALYEGRCCHGVVVKMGYMEEEVKVVNALINMYGKLGMLDDAYALFNGMKSRSLVSWNSILAVHAQHGLSNEVVGLFNSMRRVGVDADQATMVALLHGCAELGIVRQAGVVHACVFKWGFKDMLVSTSLMNLYAKSGHLNAAKAVFKELKVPDAVAWTSLLASYAMHGCGSEAIKLFKNMIVNGIRPDHVTFTHLLSACSHSGLVSEGKKYFEDMLRVYGVHPRIDHYSCIVDLLGRAGLLEDAFRLIRSMPMEPNAGVWGALLGACRIHNNLELGKEAAENLFLLNSSDNRNYIMLSNIYSASGQWIDASKIRSLLKEKHLAGNPGYSLIEHGNRIHQFVAGDQSHPNTDKIYAKLEEIIRKVDEAGLVRQTEFILHDVAEEVKLDMINKHSEKLALAFGLLVNNTCMPITIIKNLRICGDCHSVMKVVSLIETRTIIVRDPKRFHHFSNGICSCKDYW